MKENPGVGGGLCPESGPVPPESEEREAMKRENKIVSLIISYLRIFETKETAARREEARSGVNRIFPSRRRPRGGRGRQRASKPLKNPRFAIKII
jgi:hypothetical protein